MAVKQNPVKTMFIKGMETVGAAASSIANETRTRVKELNLASRRTELYAELSGKVYELWQKGVALPKELDEMVRELAQVDEELSEVRAQRVAETKIAEEKASDSVPKIVVKDSLDRQDETNVQHDATDVCYTAQTKLTEDHHE